MREDFIPGNGEIYGYAMKNSRQVMLPLKNPQLSRKFGIAVLALFLCPLTAMATKNSPPRYPVQPIGTAPVIDGKLDDACWRQLPAVGLFIDNKSKPSPAQTTVRMGYDDKNLYIAARMEEPEMDKVKADVTKPNGGVSKDDDLEIFLATDGNTTPYLVFTLNSIGTTEESAMDAGPGSFNAPWQCKVNREAHAWTAEISIPFSSLNAQKPKPEAIWYGNICRNRAHAGELSSWSKPASGFHDSNAFGELYFLDKVVLNEVNITSHLITGGVQMRIEARGAPATYGTEIESTLDGAAQSAAPELYQGFSTSPYKLAGADHTYVRPNAARIFLQPMFFEKPSGKMYYRGEATLVKETDELAVLMTNLAKSLAGFPPDQAPAAFHGLATTWPQRLAALQKTPDLVPAKILQQEIRAAQWARNLPAESASKPVLLFPTYPFTEIWYDFLPDAAVVGTPVTLQAMRREYTSTCVNVLPMDAAHDLLVSVGDLKGPDGVTLPASALDLRVLKAWYRNGYGGFQDPAGGRPLVQRIVGQGRRHDHQRSGEEAQYHPLHEGRRHPPAGEDRPVHDPPVLADSACARPAGRRHLYRPGAGQRRRQGYGLPSIPGAGPSPEHGERQIQLRYLLHEQPRHQREGGSLVRRGPQEHGRTRLHRYSDAGRSQGQASRQRFGDRIRFFNHPPGPGAAQEIRPDRQDHLRRRHLGHARLGPRLSHALEGTGGLSRHRTQLEALRPDLHRPDQGAGL